MRGDEALQAVMYFIDDAMMVTSISQILHGTGTGALRQMIRQYLGTVPGVQSYHDEHIQLGGVGSRSNIGIKIFCLFIKILTFAVTNVKQYYDNFV